MRTLRPFTATTRRALAFAALCLLAAAPRALAADGPAGEQIYRERCASCHGDSGEGTKKHPKPLVGEKSVAQLARLIAKTMPKDDPGTCTGEDAEKVAAYIDAAFYSTAAQERNKPPRVELSRLTVRQYQNSVADLVGTFRAAAGPRDDRHGLRGEYFKGSRGLGGKDRVFEQIDPTVQFDFDVHSPDFESIPADRFSIRWEGSVLAPETGTYEFIVRTEHAVRLWVNAADKPVIDAWVKSGNDTEFHASVSLLGGRAYPLRLDFSKGRQGDPDGKKDEPPPPPTKASLALLWKPPQQAAEVIPARCLSPQRSPEVYVCETPFPPDDRSTGYERGTSVSKAWNAAATDAAIEGAGYVLHHLKELAGAADGAPDRDARLHDFCRRFAERAFRRPLTDEEKQFYVERQFKAAPDAETAVKRVAMLVLLSPRFLYCERGDGPYDTASRLSLGLWDSLPDQELLAAAASGQLADREQVARQAERMTADRRARGKLREFLLEWLKAEPAPDLAKDPQRFPGFDEALASDLRTSLDLFLEDVAWGGDSDFRRLLLSDDLYLNGRLAKFYGADLPADAPFQKVKLDPGQRAGVLTHPYLLAAFAHMTASSPIHRGVFVVRGVLGVTLRPPPEAFIPLPEDLHPDLTTRERVTLQTKPQSCQACHGVINPLGYTLEHFDAVGRYRDKDNDKPVDATGAYETRAGKEVKFTGVRDLAEFLAGSDEVQTAFAEHLFRHVAKQPVQAYGPRASAELREFFAANGFSIRKLLVEAATVDALNGREDKPPPAAEGRGPPGG